MKPAPPPKGPDRLQEWVLWYLLEREKAGLVTTRHHHHHPHRSRETLFREMKRAEQAPAPNRRPRLPLGGVGRFDYTVCAPPASPAAVGEAQR
jgi:hypothetical protein